MRLLAIRSFRNPDRRIQLEKPIHPDHVHKGAIFEFGGKAVDSKAMSKEDQRLIVTLNEANCIADPTPENIARVEAELEEERGREAKDPGVKPLFDPNKTHRFK